MRSFRTIQGKSEIERDTLFEGGEPYRSIAALEAFGALLALLAFASDDSQNRDATVVIGGLTDNKGNSHVLNRLTTTKLPLCAVVMELAAQMEKTNSRIDLDWVPRELTVLLYRVSATSRPHRSRFHRHKRPPERVLWS